MSLLTVTRVAANHFLILRIAACAAREGITDPQFWAQQRMWTFAVQEGWADAYADSTADDPGEDESAITDAMIIGVVRAIWAAEQEE